MTSLNYGTTVWEGLKCFRTSTGRAAIFRPLKNFEVRFFSFSLLLLLSLYYVSFIRSFLTF